MDPIGGYDIDGFERKYKTPSGRRGQLLSDLASEYPLAPFSDPDLPDDRRAELLDEEIGLRSSAWKNAGERGAGRVEYALQDPDADKYGVMARYGESVDLLDPRTQKLKPLITAAHFFRNYEDQDAKLPPPSSGLDALTHDSAESGLQHSKEKSQQLTDNYDAEVASPLAHADDRGFLSMLTDPEKDVGWYMSRANVGPAAAKMRFGGEVDNTYDALGYAIGNMGAQDTYRLGTNSPVMDLPDDATPAEIRQRQQVIGGRQALAQEPSARERWIRTTGIDPHPAVLFFSDLLYDLLDPSLAAEVALGVPHVAGAARSVARNGLLSGLRSGAKQVAAELAPDALLETGFQAYAGMEAPEESQTKTPEDIALANAIRQKNETVRLPIERQDAYNKVKDAAEERTTARDLLGGVRN